MNMVMAMSRGADDFIAKPFDLDVLTAKIPGNPAPYLFLRTRGNVLEHKGAVPESFPLYPDLERS